MFSRADTRVKAVLIGATVLVSSATLVGQEPRLVGVSRIDESPPLPPGTRANTLVQPMDIPVPIFEVRSREEIIRGGNRNTGIATAIVYRNSHDSGFAALAKADAGNFTGNLLHLGNGFPVGGGEISGYDLLIYNSYSTPENYPSAAAATVSLWDGDPLGLIDTRISDPPQPIPGTMCTFELQNMGGLGGDGCTLDTNGDEIPDQCEGGFMDGQPCANETDCGLCPSFPGDDIPECPGLYRLVCNFDPKVTIPSRNVWMIVEYTGGCRVGWRLAFMYGPEIAAVGEENFCGVPSTCWASPVPCVDLIVELIDAASELDNAGVGACCEDPGIACDHSDGTYECGHASACSDGIATDFDAWCFGAPSYFASFVASIYANTDTTFTLIPVSASGVHRFEGDEIIMPDGGQTIEFEVFVAGWAPAELKTWTGQIDSSTYTTGLAGELTNSRPPCTMSPDCPNYDESEYCTGTHCAGAWMECPERNGLCMHLPACDGLSQNPRCGSDNLFDAPIADPGYPVYGMSLRLQASTDAKGTFEVGFIPDPGTWLRESNGSHVPIVAYIPAKITVEIGQCCDALYCISDAVTQAECDALGGQIFNANRTCNDPCECSETSDCDDHDACTSDSCVGVCSHSPLFDTSTECCHPATAEVCTRDDGNACTRITVRWAARTAYASAIRFWTAHSVTMASHA